MSCSPFTMRSVLAGMNISNFNTIYFYCQQFNQFWDFGTFTSFTNATCASLSTENFAANNFKIYPNPSKGSITIAFDENNSVKNATIYSALGQKVFASSQAIVANTSIDISTLKTGIYFLELIDADNNTVVKKISIEN